MNNQLAEAVIDTFHTANTRTHYERLSKFSYHAWVGAYSWLDASGLALYFFDRLKALNVENAIPQRVLIRLSKNYFDNSKRTNFLYEEFIKINEEFQGAGILYANIKGFTLGPDAFTEAALRFQIDLDFLIADKHIIQCQQILEKLGYLLVGHGDNVSEFKADGGYIPSLKDLYKMKSQRCVEIHFDSSFHDRIHYNLLSKLHLRQWQNLELPVLSDCDRFIAQALHLFKHLKGEWMRVSWILEYANSVNFNRSNESLWVEIERHVLDSEEIMLAIGVATSISYLVFEISQLPEVLALAIHRLPFEVSLWIEKYRKKIVLARFPGTKLYLLLCRVLPTDGAGVSKKRLFPFHRPARITINNEDKKILSRLLSFWHETSYFLFRLHFHFIHSLRYLYEAAAWKRDIKFLQKENRLVG